MTITSGMPSVCGGACHCIIPKQAHVRLFHPPPTFVTESMLSSFWCTLAVQTHASNTTQCYKAQLFATKHDSREAAISTPAASTVPDFGNCIIKSERSAGAMYAWN